MDKEQAAENFANLYMNGRVDTRVFGDLVDSFEAGADWQARQSPTDAVELKTAIEEIIEDGHDKSTYASEGGMGPDITPCNDLVAYCTPLILRLFNPSGAAVHEPTIDELSREVSLEIILENGFNDAKGSQERLLDYCIPRLKRFIDQPAAGPVWVKASERVPNHYKSIYARYEILHFGVPTTCTTILRYNVSSNKWITQKGDDFLDYSNLLWLDLSGAAPKDDRLYQLQMEFTQLQAEFIELKSKQSVPAAGAVWVDFKDRYPVKAKFYHLRDTRIEDNRFVKFLDPSKMDKDWGKTGFEWLDESGAQVFTREQVIDLLAQYPADGEYKNDFPKVYAANREIALQYMNANYPVK